MNEYTDTELETVLDNIADDISSGWGLTEALAALRHARTYDLTDSGHAAEIRDAIRDNFDPTVEQTDGDDDAVWAEINR